MSSIYEALVQAQNENKAGATEQDPTPERNEVSLPAKVMQGRRQSMDVEVFSLYRSVESAFQDGSPRIIQFIGPRGGEGVSTIVREFAKIALSNPSRRVLILDAAHHNPTQHLHFENEQQYGWLDACRKNEPIIKACYRFGKTNLFLSPITLQASLSSWIKDKASATGFFHELRTLFDLVLVDSSPASASPDSIALGSFCDGVILVIEAEKTSWRVAENARDRIVKNGGRILGIAFNKRRYYIPEGLYRLIQ